MENIKTFTKPERFFLELESDDYIETIEIRRFMELTGSPNDSGTIKPLDIVKIRYWKEYPYLIVDPDTMEILGHEGRHRLIAMQLAGYTHAEIIIQIQPNPERFSILDGADMDKLFGWKWNGIKPDIALLNPQIENY